MLASNETWDDDEVYLFFASAILAEQNKLFRLRSIGVEKIAPTVADLSRHNCEVIITNADT
jgi:hypothetical protein